MSKYIENKKVNAYRKRLQSERRINEESKNAPYGSSRKNGEDEAASTI
jgi:hypothetical protein